MTAASPRVLVVGAGLAGLAAAYELRQAGCEVQAVEPADTVGGSVRTLHSRGFVIEGGPHSFLAGATHLVALADELGLGDQVLPAAPSARRRYVYWDGRLQPVPTGPLALVRSRLLRGAAKRRLLLEPFRPRGPASGESLAAFVTRRFGPEVLERLVAPFISGVYAGDPAALDVAAAFPRLWGWEQRYGSVLLGALRGGERSRLPRGTFSFRDGMSTLPLTLAAALPGMVYINSHLLAADPLPGGGFAATLSLNGREFRRDFAGLVLAAPAHAASGLAAPFAPEVAAALAAIPYAPVAVVATGYPTEDVARPLDGFGFLVPRGQDVRILGSIWNSAIFPDRAPPGMALMTSFIGGALDPAALDLDDAALLAAVRADLDRLVGTRGEPPVTRIIRHPRAIPQYVPGHLDRIATLEQAESRLPGLAFVGNYRGGISADYTISTARQAARRLAASLGAAAPT